MPPRRPDSLVLRFGNPGVDTIEAHTSILVRRQYVWWGWWASHWETAPLAVLQDLAKRITSEKPLRLALVHRKQRRFYEAVCEELVVDDRREGPKQIGSPEADATPAHYQEKACSAWLRVTAIEKIDENEYRRRYGAMPASEATLYQIFRRSGQSIEVVPRPNWKTEPVMTDRSWILHISDMHFGEFHGYRQTALAEAREIDRPSLAEWILQRVEELDIDVGVVIASGDLITKGNAQDYEHVEPFFDALTTGLGLTREHVVIVPGNHDFRIIAEGEVPTFRNEHQAAFRHFYASYYGSPSDEVDFNSIRRFRLAGDIDLVVVALNSAKLRGDNSREYGYVGRYLYEPMLEYLSSWPRDLLLKRVAMATLHHHVLPVSQVEVPAGQRPVSLTLDAGQLMDLLYKHGVRAVLHGHQHRPFVGYTTRAMYRSRDWYLPTSADGMIVIGNGSSGARAQELSSEFPFNTFGLYRPSADGMAIQMEQYRGGTAETTFRFDVPLRW